ERLPQPELFLHRSRPAFTAGWHRKAWRDVQQQSRWFSEPLRATAAARGVSPSISTRIYCWLAPQGVARCAAAVTLVLRTFESDCRSQRCFSIDLDPHLLLVGTARRGAMCSSSHAGSPNL